MSSLPEAAPGAATPVDFGQLIPVAHPEPALSHEEAARTARSLVAAAEAEADRIRSEARAAGHAEGFAAGRAEALAEMEPTVAAVAEVLSAVRALEASHADRVESQAVELSLALAEKVVAGAITVSPERLLDVVRGALRTMIERERVTVLVHPDDVALLREAMPDLDVHEERRVTRGGALLRTGHGEIDATLETKLSRAREAVVAELSP
jgi:flagellar biosynthesis/type III secretory pathway protein FliH